METKEIIEGNKLIAEFMGLKYENSPNEKKLWYVNIPGIYNERIYGEKKSVPDKLTLKFHLSWDWLMPVVERITENDTDFCMDFLCKKDREYNFNLFIEKTNGSSVASLDNKNGETRIYTVWLAVIRFIKYHNK